MEAVFMFQWGSLFFRWVASFLSREDTPWGALVLMGAFQKSGWGGGHAPSPTMGNPAPSNSIFGRSYLKEESFNKVGRGCNCNSSIGVVPLWF